MTTAVSLHDKMHLMRPPESVRPFYEFFEGRTDSSYIRTTKWDELREWYAQHREARPVQVRAIIDKE